MKKFLLVSDSDGKWSRIAKVLEKAGGYKLSIAKTLEEAEKLIRSEKWDVIFWDYFLINQVTLELIEEARAKFPEAKMTAFSYDHRYFPPMREAGCNFELDPATHPDMLEKFILRYS